MTLKFHRGDIVLINFPFTDLSTTKLRPAVIISSDPIDRDATFAFITSLKPVPFASTDMVLPATKETGLKCESYVRFTKVATLEIVKARRRLGKLSAEMLTTANQMLSLAFGLSAK